MEVIRYRPAEQVAEAAFNMGHLLESCGDVKKAREMHSRATGMGDPKYSPAAARNLGILLESRGDADGAARAYRQAIGFYSTKIATVIALLTGERPRRPARVQLDHRRATLL